MPPRRRWQLLHVRIPRELGSQVVDLCDRYKCESVADLIRFLLRRG